jgi:nucleoside-diphosphate-sugar epimerase
LIAVSGATGFLGAHLVCRLLKKGLQVRALKRSDSNMAEFEYIYSLLFINNDAKQNLTWFEADVLDTPALEIALHGVDEVYHCAAMVSFSQKDKDIMMQANVQGTANMVNLSLIHGVKKFAFISSIAALGREKSGVHVTEKSKWVESKLNSNYAVSKYKAEMEVWRASMEGLNVVIVNPGVILGSGNWQKGSCALFNMAYKGMPFYTHGVNGYVDVLDVADATIQLMDNNIFAERFILVSENTSIKYFLDETATQLNKKKPSIEVNKILAEMALIGSAIAAFFTGKKPNLTKETSRASLNKYYYSNQKIKDKIGFEFIPIKQTIAQTCNHLLQQKKTS